MFLFYMYYCKDTICKAAFLVSVGNNKILKFKLSKHCYTSLKIKNSRLFLQGGGIKITLNMFVNLKKGELT